MLEMENKKIVVTGGAGFLGSHVVKFLLNEKKKVVVLDDFSNGKAYHLKDVENNSNLKMIKGDITNNEDVKLVFTDCDTVIHLAVLCLRESIKNPKRVNEVIVNGTINCLESSIENNVSLFLNCSSSEVYGSATYVPMDEEHPLNPETPYAAAKVAQDMYVRSYGQTYGLPWVTIRPFNMYGPNSHWQGHRGELIPKMIVRAMNNEPLVVFGQGDQTRDFVYVEDAAKAIIALTKNATCINCSINFCSSIETSIKRIAELICYHFGLDPEKFIQKQPARPGDVKRHLGSNKKIKELLGISPEISMEEGLRKTIAWFQSLPFKPEEMIFQEVLRSWE
jgi:UDP-glucose 4-epimerase